jgi:hypothetical protein
MGQFCTEIEADPLNLVIRNYGAGIATLTGATMTMPMVVVSTVVGGRPSR